MIVIAKNAEEKLLEELNTSKNEAPSRRFFYAAFSGANVPREALFECFLRHLHDIPNSYMAQVYICHDRDVFILMHGFMQRQFQAFLSQMAQELNAPNLPNIADVFEVRVDAPRIERMIGKKLESLARLRAEQDAAQKQKDAETRQNDTDAVTSQALARLNPDLVANLAQRRMIRPQPLIMIADDDQLSRTLAGNVLRTDYAVTYAKDGQSALTEYVQSAPDVLFLDIGLPDLNGHVVLETLFQIDPQAYVIMFSGRKDKSNIMRALDSGAQGFLGKPFTREKLYQHVAKSPYIARRQPSLLPQGPTDQGPAAQSTAPQSTAPAR